MNEAVIIGGGPGGAAVAILLARAGRPVLLLERDAKPADKVCGDFLSIEAQLSAASLGVDLASLGAVPISALRLVHGSRVAEARLPFTALGLSRRLFDAALLDRATAEGASIRHGAKVLGLEFARSGFSVALRDGPVDAGAVFLATGKHDLRGAVRRAQAAKAVAFKAYLSLAREQTDALRGTVEIILFDGGYAGLLLVEREVANLSLVVSADVLRRTGGTWQTLLEALRQASPHLARRLGGAGSLLARPLAISRLPYGFVHTPRPADPPALFRLGDQAAVIPSFTGDGVSIALHSAQAAASAWLAGRPASAHHQALRHDLGAQMRRASALHALCLRPRTQSAVVAACHIFPGLMRLAASMTRIAAVTHPAR